MDMQPKKLHNNMGLNLALRFWTTLILCFPVFVLNFGNHYFELHKYVSTKTSTLTEFVLSFIIVFGCGSFFFTRAWKALMIKKLDMFTLIALAVGVAWFYSLFAMLYPQDFPTTFKTADGQVPVYFAAACFVTLFVLLGHWLEMKAKMQINNDILKDLRGRFSDDKVAYMQQNFKNINNKPIPTQALVDKVAEFFILLVLLTAIVAFVLWYEFGPAPSASYALIIAVAVLLAACPCALTLAAPISITIGIHKAAQNGILINNPDIIEAIRHSNNLTALVKQKKIVFLNEDKLEDIGNAEVILLNKSPLLKNELQRIANLTMRNIDENLIIGSLYNIIMVPIAAGILFPFFGIMLTPVAASIAMSLSSLLVILNALRLKNI